MTNDEIDQIKPPLNYVRRYGPYPDDKIDPWLSLCWLLLFLLAVAALVFLVVWRIAGLKEIAQ